MEGPRTILIGGKAATQIRYHKSKKVKRMLIFLNLITIALTPVAYMPLAKIQVAYLDKCFLNTEIHVFEITTGNNLSSVLVWQHYFRLNLEKSVWGSEQVCSYLTYGLVLMQIISIITLWHIIQLWAEMMSVGNGGAMAVLLSIFYILTTANFYYGYQTFTNGFKATCDSISKIDKLYYRMSCKEWRNEIEFTEVEGMDVIYYMYLAENVQFLLIFVEAFKVLNCLSVSFVSHYSLSTDNISARKIKRTVIFH